MNDDGKQNEEEIGSLIEIIAPNEVHSQMTEFYKGRLRELIADRSAEAYKKGFIDGHLDKEAETNENINN